MVPLKRAARMLKALTGRAVAGAYCRISSYLQSMAHQGHNPLTAIQIALNGNAAEMMESPAKETPPDQGQGGE